MSDKKKGPPTRPQVKARHAARKAQARKVREDQAQQALQSPSYRYVHEQWQEHIKSHPVTCVGFTLEYMARLPIKDNEYERINVWLIEAALPNQDEQILDWDPRFDDSLFGGALMVATDNVPGLRLVLIRELVQSLPLKGKRGEKILRCLEVAEERDMRGQTDEPLVSRRPKLEENRESVKKVMGAVWAHYFWGFVWKQLTDLDDEGEALRQQVKKICNALFEKLAGGHWLLFKRKSLEREKEIQRLRRRWTKRDDARLEKILSSDAVKHLPYAAHRLTAMRALLRDEFCLPFPGAPEKSVALTRAMFHVGRTGNLRKLRAAIFTPPKPQSLRIPSGETTYFGGEIPTHSKPSR